MVPTPPQGYRTDAERTAQILYWSARIKAVGGTEAYQELGRYLADQSEGTKHMVAHLFGGALYQTEGFSGLGVCDSNFAYGCFHEFLGEAIRDHGLSIVDQLDGTCQESLIKDSLACQHGIGHGIAAYLGYDRASLDKELEVCKKLPFNDPIGGCYAGVFMEYNLRVMAPTEGRRPLVNNDYYAPCDSVGPTYQAACAFWQTQWWLSMYGSTTKTPQIYAHLGALCDGMEPYPSFRRHCYEGLGAMTPVEVNDDAVSIRALCNAASASALDRLYCLSNAANDVSIVVNHAAAEQVCDGLEGASATYCLAYADNLRNEVRPGIPPELQ